MACCEERKVRGGVSSAGKAKLELVTLLTKWPEIISLWSSMNHIWFSAGIIGQSYIYFTKSRVHSEGNRRGSASLSKQTALNSINIMPALHC